MSDQPKNLSEDALSLGSAKGKSDSQLRLVTVDGAVVFPENAEPTDDAPTIISKVHPGSEAIKASPPQLLGSLRGRHLAHFELLDPIGVGGMAAVIRARDTQLERFVALKILPPDMAQDEENIRRFHQEARAAAKLDHENIARVFTSGEDQKLHFIAFEFVEGENLRTLLERRRRLPVAEAVRIILQIAAGLEHAASRGVVHRDVKPSNIILSPNGRAKLVDMGLARSQERRAEGDLTQSGVTLGTFDYISPEQALEPREADSRSDIYSLGCTFYHMLTGFAPVPEGTAAKKLHHHQHVLPTDPRQLNPDIPNEVAVILGRMMEKDPKVRYQRPELLIQHLVQVAQKVGAGGDFPEGPLFLDAPLPTDPRQRSLRLVPVGALALALVLFLLSLAPQKTTPPRPLSANSGPIKNDPGPNPGPKGGNPPANEPLVTKSEHLATLLADPTVKMVATLRSDITLAEGGLVSQGESKRNFTLKADLYEPKTIKFKYVPKEDAGDLVAGLTLDGGTVIFHNIRFEMEGDAATPESAVAMLGIRAGTIVEFHNCTFSQPKINPRPFIGKDIKVVPMASVLIDNPIGGDFSRPRILLKNCYFQGGQVAVAVNGPAEIAATSTAFKPYGALFHLRGGSPELGVALSLERCSAFVVDGPAFRLDSDASCHLKVKHSIFSRPDGAGKKGDEIDLIRQTSLTEPAVKFEGERNCYHNLTNLWVRPDKETGHIVVSDLDKFLPLVASKEGRDNGSSLVPKSVQIWESATPLEVIMPEKAFQLNEKVPQVRTADLAKYLGIDHLGAADMKLAQFPTPEPMVAIEPRLPPNAKVVDPDAADNKGPVFQKLDSAVALADPGDVIYIKESKKARDRLIKEGKNPREIQVYPTHLLNKPGVDLILKPYPYDGHAPILNLADTTEPDAAFFTLFDGKIQFEQLEIVLQADQEGFKAQAIVMMKGNAWCGFKNCVVSMPPPPEQVQLKLPRKVPLSAVTLGDPEEAMKMPSRSPRTAPEIHLHNTYFRGEGDVVSVRSSKAFDLTLDNCLLGLDGSLLTVQGSAKDAPAESAAVVKLTNVSAFLSEPLVSLRAGKNPKGLVLTRVETAKNSLFVPVAEKPLAEKPLVVLETPEAPEENLKATLEWKGEHNAYCNFDKLLEVRRADGAPGSPLSFGLELYKEPNSKFLKDTAFTLPSPHNLWTAVPEFFLPKLEFKEQLNLFGANPDTMPKLPPSKKAE